MGFLVMSQVATGASVALMGVLVMKSMLENPMVGGGPRCPTCNGSGRVTCMCARWSDGDLGCSSCAGTGRARCRSCGGRGTGRPLPVSLVSYPRKKTFSSS